MKCFANKRSDDIYLPLFQIISLTIAYRIMTGIEFNRSMLEYCKIILSKISFDKKLFRKEYKKTFNYLEPQEHSELKRWLRNQMMNNNILKV